jgi:hypothetical protein
MNQTWIDFTTEVRTVLARMGVIQAGQQTYLVPNATGMMGEYAIQNNIIIAYLAKVEGFYRYFGPYLNADDFHTMEVAKDTMHNMLKDLDHTYHVK